MPRDKALATVPGRSAGGPVFTVERARRALVYVRRVTADIVARYRELLDLRAQCGDEDALAASPDLAALHARLERCAHTLGQLHRELLDVGCVLKDWRTGLVDFPAVYDGRRVWLCWRLGEPTIAHWHELPDGFSGRKELSPDFV
jgi:hypothetical protein